ncbi:MAG: hypothetical protein V8R59_05125 [Enterocloster sp.]
MEKETGTGCLMDSCIGLVIDEKGEDWRIYKTVWEDARAQAAVLEFAEVTSEKKGDIDQPSPEHIAVAEPGHLLGGRGSSQVA